MSTGIMSYQRNNFLETDAMFLEFENDLDNLAGGSSSVRDNVGESKNFLHFNLGLFHVFSSNIICYYNYWAGSSSQPPATPTPRRRAQSWLLELECHVAVNGCIPITIAPRAEKPIYIEVVKGNLQVIKLTNLHIYDFI